MEDITIDIYGSCISRDILEFDEKKEIKLQEYLSRTSMISAMSQPVKGINLESDCVTRWKLQCIQTDFNKDHFHRLSRSISRFLLIDLIDERWRIMRILRGGDK